MLTHLASACHLAASLAGALVALVFWLRVVGTPHADRAFAALPWRQLREPSRLMILGVAVSWTGAAATEACLALSSRHLASAADLVGPVALAAAVLHLASWRSALGREGLLPALSAAALATVLALAGASLLLG